MSLDDDAHKVESLDELKSHLAYKILDGLNWKFPSYTNQLTITGLPVFVTVTQKQLSPENGDNNKHFLVTVAISATSMKPLGISLLSYPHFIN